MELNPAVRQVSHPQDFTYLSGLTQFKTIGSNWIGLVNEMTKLLIDLKVALFHI